ncbi:MAG: hypothetical protein RLZZ471_459 [Actinomycetota bacterium]
MAAYCQVTETGPQFGHHVSHAQNKTKRRFNPVPSLKRNVTLNLSARGIKVIDVRGIEAVIAELKARGEKF